MKLYYYLQNKLIKFFTPTDKNHSKEIQYVQKLVQNNFKDYLYVPSYSELCKKLNIKYKHDLLFNLIPWDYQFNSEQLIKRGGGDCNSLHRLLQVIYYLKGKDSYLLHMFFTPFKGHTTCLIIDEEYTIVDYDSKITGPTLKNVINQISEIYEKVNYCYLETIDWKIYEPR